MAGGLVHEWIKQNGDSKNLRQGWTAYAHRFSAEHFRNEITQWVSDR